MQTTIIFLQQKISRSKIHVRLLYHDNRPHSQPWLWSPCWTTLTFSFLMTNDAAPLLSSLGSLSPPRRLRLVVPWFSCWVMSDGEDGSTELQLQTTREVSACMHAQLLLLDHHHHQQHNNNEHVDNNEEHIKMFYIVSGFYNSYVKIKIASLICSFLPQHWDLYRHRWWGF